MFELLNWLLKKDKYKCPRCNYPIFHLGENDWCCEYCGQPMSFEVN